MGGKGCIEFTQIEEHLSLHTITSKVIQTRGLNVSGVTAIHSSLMEQGFMMCRRGSRTFRCQVRDTQEYIWGCLLGLDVKEGFESLCDLCNMALQLSHPGLSLGEIGGVGSHGPP
jgi:hypothetical protein